MENQSESRGLQLSPLAIPHFASIIVRTYNSQDFVTASIQSALRQTEQNYEIIVVDDGSTDRTVSILESLRDPKLRLFRQPRLGAFQAAYTGLRHARGDKIMLLDSDDQLAETAVEELSLALQKSEYGFSYSDYDEIDLSTGSKKYVSLSNIFNALACGMMFKRSVLEHLGFWDRSFLLPEYDLIIRVMKRYQGCYIPKPLYVYNRHGRSMTADRSFVQKAKEQIFAKYGVIEGFKEY